MEAVGVVDFFIEVLGGVLVELFGDCAEEGMESSRYW